MPTPHIAAEVGDFAETVLLPGDPRRAKFVADTFLDDVSCINEVRNMLGYTGHYQGFPVSVMGTGMGIPSASIYVTELFEEYGVKQVIRVGSCGSIHPEVNVGDLVAAIGASTDSNVNRLRFLGHDFAAVADYGLLRNWVGEAEAQGVSVVVGNIFSTDTFYHLSNEIYEAAARLRIVAVEMEAAAIYRIAAEHGGRALCVLTVSDQIAKGESMSASDRESSFVEMMRITLDSLS